MKYITLHHRPDLKRPVLIIALSGWGDAGNSATMALQYLANSWEATKFGEIQSEPFFAFDQSRPWVRLGRNGERELTWPSLSLFFHHDSKGDLDAILLTGPEPSLHWQTFVREIVDLVRSFNAHLVVTLGAYLANVSHRERVPLSGWAWPSALEAQLKTLQIDSVTYEGPTGLLTAIAVALADENVPVASLWAAVPAFLGPTPNPKGALALLTCLNRALDLGLDLAPLKERSREFERQVDGVVARVKALRGVALQEPRQEHDEPSTDTEPLAEAGSAGPVDLPTPEEAVNAVEEFLRRKDQSQ